MRLFRCTMMSPLLYLILALPLSQAYTAFTPARTGQPPVQAALSLASRTHYKQGKLNTNNYASFPLDAAGASRRRSISELFLSTEARAQDEITQNERLELEEKNQYMEMTEAEKTDEQLFDATVFANGSVLLLVTSAVVYSLFHVHIEALLALWEYDLGQLDSPELTKIGVAIELMTRLPVDWVRSYEGLVPTNPIFYKACTSGVAYALGDFISQLYQGSTLKTLDLPRSLRSGAAGFIGHGPLCHYWLTFMETYLDFSGAWWATGIKVTADLTVWAIFLNAAYSFIIGSLALRDPRDVFEDVKVTSWPALRSAWRFWPFVHTVSFSHAVPMDLKLLWVDIMEVVWVTILSKVANEDKNASRQMEDEDVEGNTALESKTQENQDMMELPKKVLAACWPLIVMWPVLYGGYQIEKFLGLEV